MPKSMKYCVLENAYRLLLEAQEKLDNDKEGLSESERKYRGYLIDLCATIAEEHGDTED